MTTNYRYQEPSKPIFALLPPGEYSYVVLEAEPPHIKPESGNHVMNLKLGVGPEQKHVTDSPWAGATGDKIASFLASCNRAPAVGQEPEWHRLVGAKGRVKIKIRPASCQYDEKNEVSYYIHAKDVKQSSASFTPSQVASGEIATRKNAGDPDLDAADQDSIPF